MNGKSKFLEEANDFVKFGDLDPNKYLPILEHDYDTLIGLGFEYTVFVKPPAEKRVWLSFMIYLTDTGHNRSTLNIMIIKGLLEPIRYVAYITNDTNYRFSENTLEDLLEKIMEAANAN